MAKIYIGNKQIFKLFKGDKPIKLATSNNSSIKFNTIADMKAADLKVGDTVETLGYYEIGDGGATKYEIMDYDNWLLSLPDYLKLVCYFVDRLGIPWFYKNPVDNYINHKLDNGLVAKPKFKNIIKVEQAGLFEGRNDNCDALIHLFANIQSGEILFGKNKIYEIYYRTYNQGHNMYNELVTSDFDLDWIPEKHFGTLNEYALLLGNRHISKPCLGYINNLKLNGNGCTLHIPDNEFCKNNVDFAIIEMGGTIEGLEITGFTLDCNGLKQKSYIDNDGNSQTMRTSNHAISYFTGGISSEHANSAATKYPELNIQLENLYNYENKSRSKLNNINIHHNTFLATGTIVDTPDGGGDHILFINPIQCNNLFIEDNEFYNWGRWVFSIDLGGDGERFNNVKFNRNICTQNEENYIPQGENGRAYRGLGWIDFEARKCFTNLEVCDNVVHGLTGFAFNGNAKISENVTVCRNELIRPTLEDGYTWRSAYGYVFEWYYPYIKNLVIEDNYIRGGNFEYMRLGRGIYNLSFKNNDIPKDLSLYQHPMYGDIIFDNNIMPGLRGIAFLIIVSGEEFVFENEEKFINVTISNHTGGYPKIRHYEQTSFPISLTFGENNQFSRMDIDVWGMNVEFDPNQMINKADTWAMRGAKFTNPTAFFGGFRYEPFTICGGGNYDVGDIICETETKIYRCTKAGHFCAPPVEFLKVEHEERSIDKYPSTTGLKENYYIKHDGHLYRVISNDGTGLNGEVPTHTSGDAQVGGVVLRYVTDYGEYEEIAK